MLRKTSLYVMLTTALAAGIFAMGGHLEAEALDGSQPKPDELVGHLILTEEFPVEPVTFHGEIQRFRSETHQRPRSHILRATVVRSTDLQSGWQQFTTRVEAVDRLIELREIDLEDLARGLAYLQAQRGKIIDAAVMPTELEYRNAAIVIRVAFDGAEVRSSIGSAVAERERGRHDCWRVTEQLDALDRLVEEARKEIATLKAE
jgi:hypothetical protein